jgi:rSAM/selenodomain-associated transferase 1
MSTQRKSNAVFVFSKAPELGKVKTRLAKSVGDEAALNVYRALLKTVVESVTQPAKWDVYLSAANNLEHPFFNALSDRYSLKHHLQVKGDLGQKMLMCLKQGLTRYQKVIIVGGDAISISSEIIAEMLISLDSADVTITPSEDGGYIAIGAKNTHLDMFNGISWGTSSVFEQQLFILCQVGLECAVQPSGWDLDDLEDFKRVKSNEKYYEVLLGAGLDPCI